MSKTFGTVPGHSTQYRSALMYWTPGQAADTVPDLLEFAVQWRRQTTGTSSVIRVIQGRQRAGS